MRRGPWHQMGDRSQRMVIEHLQNGRGIGVIISPRDLAKHNAVDYANEYRALKAEVLYDPQFHVPGFSNTKIESYPTNQFRTSVSELHQISEPDLNALSIAIENENREIGTDAVIAPAVVYEAQRPDIVNLNARLHEAATRAAEKLDKPIYGTIVIGTTATSSELAIDGILSDATGLESDGWYYAFEFAPARLPTSVDAVTRCCRAGLTLACTGKPVLHAYAGPLGLLSPGFGATGVAVGHSQNLWRFCRDRWESADTSGGGDSRAPPRFFSSTLWGTIVWPDEVRLLNRTLQSQVLTHSPFSQAVTRRPPGEWARWDANKHLVHTLCTEIAGIHSHGAPRDCAVAARQLLERAIVLHGDIAQAHVSLKDNTNAYQANWRDAIESLLSSSGDDYGYLELLS